MNAFEYCDEIGPIKMVSIYRPKVGLKAVCAIDNVAAGPAIGGVRMAPDVTATEAFRLARAMTFKNIAAGLPHGGGKSVIQADPKMLSGSQKEELIRAFAKSIQDLKEYIPGPDMGTNELCMAWIKDEINRSVGLPLELGGIPLDEIGATGFGLKTAIEVAFEFYQMQLKGARVAIQGFGAVGKHVARFLVESGAVIVGVSDSQGSVIDSNGLDIRDLIELKENHQSFTSYSKGKKGSQDALLEVECEVWIPAARPDVIHEKNMHLLNTKMIAQGANIPLTAQAEKELSSKGVYILPDFIANAGGVICGSVEYHGGTQQVALQNIEEKIRRNTLEVLARAEKQKIMTRDAAIGLAKDRLLRAEKAKRF